MMSRVPRATRPSPDGAPPERRPRRRSPDRHRALRIAGAICATVGLLGGAAAVVLAQTPYQGVVPGSGQPPPRSRVALRGGERVTVTWPGFQMLPDGRSRFFVQTTGPVTHEPFPEQGRYVLLLRNARMHLRNTRRPLVTRFFDTPVRSAKLLRRGKDLAFVLELRPGVTARPNVRQEGGAPGTTYRYLYIEFPDGDWLPAADRPPPPSPDEPAELTPEEREQFEALDDEAPPDLGEVGEAGR